MRNMQTSNRTTQSKLTTFGKRSTLTVLTVGLITLLGGSLRAQAQQAFGNYPVSATTMNLGANPITSHKGFSVVDSTYRPKESLASDVSKASYLGDWGYQALQEAEGCPGAYGCTRCDFTWYFSGELVGFRREGDRRFSLTQNQFMDRGDYELGTRATIGRMCDCATAYEFVFVGPFYWERGSTLTGPANVNSRFFAFPIGLDDAFNDADSHVQRLISRSSSFELNRRRWAWDAVSTLIGIRYFNYEEAYSLSSERSPPRPAPLSGRYTDEIENHLIGPQIGGDIFFATSLKTSISLRGKAGIFANFATRELRLVEPGGTALFNAKDKVDIAGLFELGIAGNYQITPSIRLSGGYEVWYVPGMGTVARQSPNILSGASGTNLRLREDLFLHGFNAGVQVLF